MSFWCKTNGNWMRWEIITWLLFIIEIKLTDYKKNDKNHSIFPFVFLFMCSYHHFSGLEKKSHNFFFWLYLVFFRINGLKFFTILTSEQTFTSFIKFNTKNSHHVDMQFQCFFVVFKENVSYLCTGHRF